MAQGASPIEEAVTLEDWDQLPDDVIDNPEDDDAFNAWDDDADWGDDILIQDDVGQDEIGSPEGE